MALDITDNLKQALLDSKVTPVLVFKLEGYDKIFNNTLIKTYIKIGDPGLKIGEPMPPSAETWKIGGFKTVAEQSPFVNFNIGTTTKITQKLDPSRGLGSSVSQMTIVMVDPNEEITNFITPGNVLEEILGRRATIYLGVENSTWPDDYNVVFRGNVQDIESGSGFVAFYLNNTEERKRQAIFPTTTGKTEERVLYRANVFQALYYQNVQGINDTITITFQSGVVAGSETVSVVGNTITITIEPDFSSAAQVKKVLEDSSAAMQLITVELDGDKETKQIVNSFNLITSAYVALTDATGFLDESDNETLIPYVKIGGEMIRYENVSLNALLGATRGEFNSIPESADIDEDVEHFVRLKGNAIDLILKLLLSTGPEYYAESVDIESIGEFLTEVVPNALFFKDQDVEQLYGIVPGDTATITGSAIPGNNVTDSIVLSVGKFIGGSFVILSDTLTDELTTTGTISFKSQFNTLPIGIGMLPSEVDIAQHIFIRDTFLPAVELDLVTSEIPNGKEYIESQLYLPISCYSVPRKGRSSIVYQIPPIATNEVVTLNLSNVVNPQSLRVRRSIGENFFNEVIFYSDYDPVSGTYKTTYKYSSSDSQTRIPVGSKAFKLQSKSLRATSGASQITSRTAERLLRRYQFGAEYVRGIKLLFGVGFKVEIGDAIAVDFGALKLSDTRTGTRDGDIRLMEVLNKTLDAKTGDISIDVVDTVFGVNDRLGLISPSSYTGVGSTTTKLILQKSFSTKSYERESTKWQNGGYIGQKIRVRTADFTTQYETTIRGFDNNDPQGMLIDAIPTAPGSGWLIDSPEYPTTTAVEDLSFWKFKNAYFSPQVRVTNVATLGQDKFKIGALDLSKFLVGASAKVHNYDYTDDGIERKVIEVNPGTNTITLDGDVGFDIDDTHYVDLIGFPDGGAAYRII